MTVSAGRSGPPPLRRMIVPALFVGALFLAVFLRQPNGPPARDQWELSGQTMGTVFSVKIVAPSDPDLTEEEVAEAVRGAVDGVDASMSTWRPDSELSRFNDYGTEAFEASPALLDVFSEARRVAELTGGAFDITVGPLVEAWGFGPEPTIEPPDDDEIERLLADNGFRRIGVDTDGGTLRKDRAGLRCDLSAIAKGFAVDRVADELAQLGFADFMVEIGGEVRTAGRNAAGLTWRIGVERPEAGARGIWSAVELRDAGMATSGDYRNYYEINGVRVSHLIDPRTGRPVIHRLASVSVVHPSCMTADALATALMVIGPEDGRTLAEREGLAVLFLIRNAEGGFDEWTSSSWPGENTAAGTGVAPGEDR